jgi:L-seryl-tRNA(Ser) seleniumtransferase
MPSAGIAIGPTGSVSLANLATALRGLDEPVIGRIRDGALLLDLRCLPPGQEEAFLANLAELSLGAR